MVAAVSTPRPNPKVSSHNLSYQNPKRPPLLPSEAENGPPRRPKSKEVTSRYLSTSSSSSVSTTSSSNTSSTYSSSSNSIASRRSQSPMVTRAATPVRAVATPVQSIGSIKRSQSVDRRRPGTPAVAETTSAAAKLLLTSTRSLSVSFQGQSFSIPVSKAKPAPVSNNFGSSVRKGTPERRKVAPDLVTPDRRKVVPELVTPVRDRTENVKTSDQRRWPGRSKPVNSCFLTRSLDCGPNDKPKFGSGSVVRSLTKSVIDGNHSVRIEPKWKPLSDNVELGVNSAYGSALSVDTVASDSESVSSGSISGVHDGPTAAQVRGGPRGIVVPARFWQETNNRIRRGPEPGSPVKKSGGLETVAPSKQMANKKFLIDSAASSPRGVPASRGLESPLRGGPRPASPRGVAASRGLGSPLRGGPRPSSPNRPSTPSTNSPFRGMPSPTRTRNGVMGTIVNNACMTPSVLSFPADARRGKAGENRIVDAHELRLLYNRHLQSRFVNARAEAALKAQTETAERNLYNAWLATSKLRHSVKSKRIQLQLLRQNVKLYSILKGQLPCLENWDLIDGDHCNSMSGAICALEASTIRLPVVGGARAEVQSVKDAISSAVDVMRSMASSICSLLPKVEEVDLLVHELANVVENEHALLDDCKDLLSSLTAVQVNDCSLRTHILQLKRVVSCSTTEV